MSVDFKLYLITDRKQTKMPLAAAVRLALEGGVRSVQVREKDLPVRDLIALSLELRAITKEFGARLFINDRVDVAMAINADGVHLGHESMPVEAVRRIVGKGMLIGVSTHNVEEAKSAQAGGADFITYGPIFETPSKAKLGVPVGVESIIVLKQELSVPIFALGGINSGNLKQVMGVGASGVGMISAIMTAADIRQTSHTIIKTLSLY